MILDTLVNVTIGAAALLHRTSEDPPGTHGAPSQTFASTAHVGALHSGVKGDESCQDYGRWDGAPYTSVENYPCHVYCQTGWCNTRSYVTNASNTDRGVPIYVDGEVGTYYTLERMLKTPFAFSPEIRFSDLIRVGVAAEQLPHVGMHWYPWDAETAEKKLNDRGLTFPRRDLLTGQLTQGKMPEKEQEEACKHAGEELKLSTWLMNEAPVNCKNMPEVVKRANVNLNPIGQSVRELWLNVCNESHETPYNFTCYASGSNTMLWDANYDPSTYDRIISSHFNLPWDVACCCCGGGTTKNKPGGKMLFKISKSWWSIAAKLTAPTLNQSLFDSFVENGVIDTYKHRDWQKRLYPDFEKVRKDFYEKGLVYTFRQKTYTPVDPEPYPYGPGKDCEDYQLDRDIENSTLQFKGKPEAWAGWAGYTCFYNFYAKACNSSGVQDSDNLRRFGGLERFFNGLIKKSVVSEWNFTEGKPDISLDGMRRADPWKVCCACGGGKKRSGEAPKRLIDMFDDSYYTN